MSHRKLIVGNWKMNPASFEEAKRIAKQTRASLAGLEHVAVVVCPPLPFISAALSKASVPGFHVGAQIVSVEESGPHTGQVSARMLASMGVSHVVAGHSEARRAGDTDEIVSKKIARIVDAGLTPIVCVGEESRDEGGAHLEALADQIRKTFAGISEAAARKAIIAYEPVWAIGAKAAMQPEVVYEMSLFVRKVFSDLYGQEAGMKALVLYGGSVDARNAADIMRVGKVDGLFVGRQSVIATGFKELLKAVDAVS